MVKKFFERLKHIISSTINAKTNTKAYFSFFENQNTQRQQIPFEIEHLKTKGNEWAFPITKTFIERQTLFPNNIKLKRLGQFKHADVYAVFGHGFHWMTSSKKIINHAIASNKPVYMIEDGFFRSVTTYSDTYHPVYTKSIGITVDDLAYHFDSLLPSRLELILNSTETVSEKNLDLSKKMMAFILENHLTKYNHQPIYEPDIGKRKEKVLVVDQSYGDFSIIRSQCDESTFKDILACALKENPNADIIIKTHPDIIVNGKKMGYYTDLKEEDRVILWNKEINPSCLFNMVQKVYTCSSQLGFEALIHGCNVATFGVPFYSGWGLTDDRHKAFHSSDLKQRRSRKRTLEELFYFACIWYCHYINPDTETNCDIEEALSWLLNKRNEYFKERSSKQ